MAPSRMERFVSLIGGEQNLPPRVPSPPPPPPPAQPEKIDSEDLISQLPTVEKVITEHALLQSRATPPNLQLSADILAATRRHNMSITPTNIDLNYDPRVGEPAPLGLSFCPFLAVTKFCYKFVRREYQQLLATAFFDANKIWNRDWDLYYVWSDDCPTAKPVTFVPEHQLQALIAEINTEFPQANITITDEVREEGLVISFDGLPTDLRPRWLGHSTSRDQHSHWVDNLPMPKRKRETSCSMASDRDLESFRRKMEDAIEVSKAKSKAKRKGHQQAAVQLRMELSKQVLRAQRCLGLLAKKVEGLDDVAGISISQIDPSKPAPHLCDSDVIFIALDAEAYERSPKVVTEVGVATLDTRDLQNHAPGSVGQDWHKYIRARHFRIIEHRDKINKDFCVGCPGAFEFGESEFVGKDNIASVLTSCFHQPFSKVGSDDVATGENKERRNIVLIGHDLGQDIQYMNQIGFSVLNRGNLLEAMDTSVMFKSYNRESQATSLGKVLYHFDLTGWHLHNAGNDAVYTLWALLAICVKQASERGSEEAEKRHEENLVKRAEAAVEQAKEKVYDDAEGWVPGSDEDGGAPVAPKEENFQPKSAKVNRPTFGPPRPPAPGSGLYTMGGAPLDV